MSSREVIFAKAAFLVVAFFLIAIAVEPVGCGARGLYLIDAASTAEQGTVAPDFKWVVAHNPIPCVFKPAKL